MKSRQPKGGAAAATAAERRKRKNWQRLGGKGGGLSLESFASAKSSGTGYNPAFIKKQREFYRNAKIVKKYKKSVKQQNYDEHLPAASIPESQDGNENEKKSMKKKKKNGSLRSIRREYEKMQEEKERARKEREATIQAKEEERQRAEAKRKALREKMFKRTSSGQPVMKYRIEHLLENILQTSSN